MGEEGAKDIFCPVPLPSALVSLQGRQFTTPAMAKSQLGSCLKVDFTTIEHLEVFCSYKNKLSVSFILMHY